ncbi:MAG: cupin domain-containing protein, partial [Myxococcaceae bacterium]
MSEIAVKKLSSPDQTVKMVDKGKFERVNMGGMSVSKLTLEPGWTWREHEQPLSGTKTCEVEHLGYCSAGRVKVVMTDGAEREIGPGDAFYISPGHDAWVVGQETFVAILLGPRE